MKKSEIAAFGQRDATLAKRVAGTLLTGLVALTIVILIASGFGPA